MALGFGADCIKIVVSMATDRSHRLTMGKTKKKPGVDSLHRPLIGKKLKKSSSLKPLGPQL